jgi:thiol:disulfide interchange protein DsbA
MRNLLAAVGMLLAALVPTMSSAQQQQWIEGKHYVVLRPAVRTNVPAGKVEVAEAFSYGCPACFSFHPIAKQLQGVLPSNAQFIYQHASFNSAESWPLFQRAFLTAQALGILEKTHDAMLNAVWQSGELAVVDKSTQRLKNPQPTIEQVAKFYERAAGVKAADFIAASKSFGVESGINRTEAWMRAARIEQTPTLVINGKYRLTVQSAGGVNEMFALVDYLVKKESGAQP